jgi:hypothetical protein
MGYVFSGARLLENWCQTVPISRSADYFGLYLMICQ